MIAEFAKNTQCSLIFILIFSFSFFYNHVYSQRKKIEPGSGFLVLSGGLSTLVYSDIGDPFKEESFLYDSKTNVYGNNTVYSLGFQQYIIGNFGCKLAFQQARFGRTDNGRGVNSTSDNIYVFETKLNQFEARLQYDFYHFDFLAYNAFYAFVGFGYLFGSAQITELTHNGTPQDKTFTSPYIPFGGGYSLNLANRFSIGAEADINYMFSDLIDGKKPNEGSTWSYDIAASLKLIVSYRILDDIGKKKRDKYLWK